MSANSPADLKRIYETRFSNNLDYRRRVWRILIDEFFQRHFVGTGARILDLGCGYGEFINQVRGSAKYAMDLNPDARQFLEAEVDLLLQDCSAAWAVDDASLDVVFTSNFFEHLPDKSALGRTLDEISRCLAPGGRLIALGPNIRFLPGAYWDFWDHYLPLTEKSLVEALTTRGFEIERCEDRFLPYTMANGPRYPLAMLSGYLKMRPAWKFFGKQFLVVATKPK